MTGALATPETARAAGNPFVGLGPLPRVTPTVFFGRDREISELYSLVVAHQHGSALCAVGCGKASLLKAGLIPLLLEGGL